VPDDFPAWAFACLWAVGCYHALRAQGDKREQARYVLPHAIATSLVHTTNLREWNYMVRLRTGKAAAPEMQFLFGKVRAILDKATDHLLDKLCE
jgi:thymidylate synthase ThyX